MSFFDTMLWLLIDQCVVIMLIFLSVRHFRFDGCTNLLVPADVLLLSFDTLLGGE